MVYFQIRIWYLTGRSSEAKAKAIAEALLLGREILPYSPRPADRVRTLMARADLHHGKPVDQAEEEDRRGESRCEDLYATIPGPA